MYWKIRDSLLSLDKTLLMGVLNLTPDSFSDGGQFIAAEKAIEHGLQLVQQGADILDLGGESTRPGAPIISAEEQLARVLPVLVGIRKKSEVPISVDTTQAAVAKICLENGANIINDVSGLNDGGQAMAELVAKYEAGLVMMHRRGDAQTMQSFTQYEDVVREVIAELRECLERALAWGIARNQIVMDPGLGFSKDATQNFELLRRLEAFQELGLPMLVGPSRKSFIGLATGREVGEREFGTAAACALAISKGAQILRVHQVAAMRDVARVSEAIGREEDVRTF